jgi:hypothetical protein
MKSGRAGDKSNGVRGNVSLEESTDGHRAFDIFLARLPRLLGSSHDLQQRSEDSISCDFADLCRHRHARLRSLRQRTRAITYGPVTNNGRMGRITDAHRGYCPLSSSPSETANLLTGEMVRRERRWTSAGVTPARELVRSTR